MIKKIIPIVLLPCQVMADVTWVQATDISYTAISDVQTNLYTTEYMSFKYVDGRQYDQYQTYCSTSQSEAEADTGTGTLRSTIGEYNWSSYATSVAYGSSSSLSNLVGMMRGTGINRGTLTMYCLLHPPGVAAKDASVAVTGLIVTADLATVPQPFIELSQSEVDMGSCRTGEQLQSNVPSSLYYKGYATSQTSSLSWDITSDTANPDSSLPVVYVNGNNVSPADVPLLQDPFDADIELSYICGAPGSYKWNMAITFTIE
ncbi:hypothetical protein [Enterobacter ludwigii]